WQIGVHVDVEQRDMLHVIEFANQRPRSERRGPLAHRNVNLPSEALTQQRFRYGPKKGKTFGRRNVHRGGGGHPWGTSTPKPSRACTAHPAPRPWPSTSRAAKRNRDRSA